MFPHKFRFKPLHIAVFETATDLAPRIGTEKVQTVLPIAADYCIARTTGNRWGTEVADAGIKPLKELGQFVGIWIYQPVVRKVEVEAAMDIIPIRAFCLDHAVPQTLKEVGHS